MKDLIIIGAGPAGMTAAVYTGRKGIQTMVISKDIGGQVNWTTNVENYMGFQEISGSELVSRFEEQMKDNHMQLQDETVEEIKKGDSYFEIITKEKKYFSRAVVLASGKRPKMLNVPGEIEFRGKGVSYCSTCDAPFYKNLPVAVVGGGNSAVQAVLDLSKVAKEIHLLLWESLSADQILQKRIEKLPNLKIYQDVRVKEIKGDKLVKAVVVENIRENRLFDLNVDGIFVEIGLEPNNECVQNLVTLNTIGEVIVDCHAQTNIDGLLAAGDVTNVPEKQIIVAAGEGAKAALSAVEYLIFGHRLKGHNIKSW